MKSLIKLSFLVAVVAVVAAGSASADDQRLQDRLARTEAQPSHTTTVAVYTDSRGIGRHAEQQDETHYVLRYNAHGQVYRTAAE